MKIKQIRDKLKEGCGKNYGFMHPKYCGDMGTEVQLLCEECKAKLQLLDEIIPAFIEGLEEWWYEQNDGGVDEFDVGYVKIYRGDIEELIKNLKEEAKT